MIRARGFAHREHVRVLEQQESVWREAIADRRHDLAWRSQAWR